MTFRMFRHVALYGIITIRFPPETISDTIGRGGREDVMALLLSRISDTTLEELRYTTSVDPSRKRNLHSVQEFQADTFPHTVQPISLSTHSPQMAVIGNYFQR